MISVGGILPAKGAASIALGAINAATWRCRPLKSIKTLHLTMREAALLQSMLPRGTQLTRSIVKTLGFDLEDDQIETFQSYYKQYPAFAQIVV
jgi:hypothetical protein